MGWAAYLIVVGGLFLLMTYYGVNFFLSGLHSYAGASTDSVSFPAWLIGWLAFEVAVAGAAFIRRNRDLKRAPERETAVPAVTGDEVGAPAS